jgi:hypothetical protein
MSDHALATKDTIYLKSYQLALLNPGNDEEYIC